MMEAPSNKSNLMSLDAVLSAVGGQLLSNKVNNSSFLFSSIATDSRNCKDGSLFIPLIGSIDGHDFIEQAYSNGARSVFVTEYYADFHSNEIRGFCEKGMCVISVSHTMYALQHLAAAYVLLFKGLKKIGITGSSGKTTTKEILVALLSQKYSVVYNQGNLNSETGLPLSVFAISKEHEYGVFEMGMNRKGEISELAAVLKPYCGIITNIGTAHIGILGTKQLIAEEKKKIFSFFNKDSLAVIPSNDEFFDFLQKDIKGTILPYGDYKVLGISDVQDLGLLGTSFTFCGLHITFPLPGLYNFSNAIAAMTLALKEGLSAYDIKKGFDSIKPLFGRSQVITGDVTVIQDCYNANPDSMIASCEFFESLEWHGNKWYVLGDMLELGDESEEAHSFVGTFLASSRANGFFLYGTQMLCAAEELKSANKAENLVYSNVETDEEFENFVQKLSEKLCKGDIVFIKGSRGMRLERVTAVLDQKFSLCNIRESD